MGHWGALKPMIYIITGLCLITAVVTSWQLSATPLLPEREQPEETPVIVSASDLIHAQMAAQMAAGDNNPRPAPRADAPAPFAGDARI